MELQETKTTKEDVEFLLWSFRDYHSPDGTFDPWFTLMEINRQFQWSDIHKVRLRRWLREWVKDGKVETEKQDDGQVWRWLF